MGQVIRLRPEICLSKFEFLKRFVWESKVDFSQINIDSTKFFPVQAENFLSPANLVSDSHDASKVMKLAIQIGQLDTLVNCEVSNSIFSSP